MGLLSWATVVGLTLLAFSGFPGASATCDLTCLTALKRDLLTDYDRFARPAEITNLNISITAVHVEVVEEKNTFILHGWTKLIWNDSRLKWNKSEYGGRKSIHLMDHEIWQPDLEVYNTAATAEQDHFGSTRCIVYAEGTVLWVPPSKMATLCDIDLKNWPYDTQKCMVKLGSWTYSSLEINLQLDKSDVYEKVIENPPWKILKLESAHNLKYYPCCEEPYPDVTFNFTVYRQAGLQKAIVTCPLWVVMLITLAAFWLPAQAYEKVVLQAVDVLILVIFLKYFAETLPDVTTQTPLIVKCYSALLLTVLIALIVSVISVRVSRTSPQSGKVPALLRVLIDSWYGTFLGLKGASRVASQPKSEELKEAPFDDPEQSQIGGKSAESPNVYWLLLATFIDRSAFLLLFIFYIVLAVEYLI